MTGLYSARDAHLGPLFGHPGLCNSGFHLPHPDTQVSKACVSPFLLPLPSFLPSFFDFPASLTASPMPHKQICWRHCYSPDRSNIGQGIQEYRVLLHHLPERSRGGCRGRDGSCPRALVGRLLSWFPRDGSGPGALVGSLRSQKERTLRGIHETHSTHRSKLLFGS